jgi:type II secretory pathway predicted ATPase ExeA
MLSEVIEHFGFTRDLHAAGYHETPYHRQVLKGLHGAIHAGRLVAFTGLVGSVRFRAKRPPVSNRCTVYDAQLAVLLQIEAGI